MQYTPAPIDTKKVKLSDTLAQLTEKLAEHTHDIWAASRLSQGRTFGPKRDDDVKQHPCLVPYDQLSETEKQYDRDTALGTLKAILALGYAIQEAPPKPARKKKPARRG